MSPDSKQPRRGGGLGGQSRDGASIYVTDFAARAERAQGVARDAFRWRETHGDAWDFLIGAVLGEVGQGRRASAKWALELVRKHDFSSFDTPYPKVSNSYAPAFARMICAAYPEARGLVEIRKSILDYLNIDWSRA